MCTMFGGYNWGLLYTATSKTPPSPHPLYFTSSKQPSETLQHELFENAWLKLEHPVALQSHASPSRKFLERVQRFTSQPCPVYDSVNVSISTDELQSRVWDREYYSKQTHRPAPGVRLKSANENVLTDNIRSLYVKTGFHKAAWCSKADAKQEKNNIYQIIIMKTWSSRDSIPRVAEHLSMIFTSQTVGCQWCGGFTEKLRVLPRSKPNIIPHGGGHRSRCADYITTRNL